MPCYALTACLWMAITAVMLTACSDPPPVQINLAALREYQGELDGRRVVVEDRQRLDARGERVVLGLELRVDEHQTIEVREIAEQV